MAKTLADRAAEALTDLTGVAWKVRCRRAVVTTLPSGRLFWAEAEGWTSRWLGFTGAGLGTDVRCAGCTSVDPRHGERLEDVVALGVGALYERARDDPRNRFRVWLPSTPEDVARSTANLRADVAARQAAIRYLDMQAARSSS